MNLPQPVCWACWDDRKLGRWPALRSDAVAHCCYCGHSTRDGLTASVDPALVPYSQDVAS